ncbi:MAG: D-2-hydroxyacid dehydrogenase family protein [Paracoccus sp. (in: a-proteobacteria)]|nr:D-2-hydroxyacid dehydrogenase family protein [Paracoccus sp. (in: a-proteobacteria)]
MTRVAVLDDYAGAAMRLADWPPGCEVTVFRDGVTDPAALIERLRPFEVVCVMRERTPLPAQIINALPSLRLIVTTGARNLSIDVAAAHARGIVVSGTESRGSTTAEFVMALMLALSRRIPVEANSAAQGGWQSGLGRDLSGQVLGIAGYGRIGRMVARLARPFGLRVLAWSRSLTAEGAAACGVDHVPDLPALLGASDIVSVHLVLSEETRGLFGAAQFAAMRPDTLFLNTSRGPIVQTDALLDALRSGHLGGAALDVHDVEPLPAGADIIDAELISQGRLLVTPHLGYVSEQTFAMFYRQSAEAVAAWLKGAPIRLLTPGPQPAPESPQGNN